MWNNLPFDLLANIFSYLSLDSLARAGSACRSWYTCAKAYPLITPSLHSPQPWFVAMSTISQSPFLFAHNPVSENWHKINMDFLSGLVKPIAPIQSLLLLRLTSSSLLKLALCNPFTRQVRLLPRLTISRTNPAVGVVTVLQQQYHSSNKQVQTQFPRFKVYVAGGMSESAEQGGATYEPTSEMYDSEHDTWQVVGSMPIEFAVRLTVWTPNECVYCDGCLYWITSARVYSLMGYDIKSNAWRGFSVPMAEQLEFAALVQRNGVLALVGGAYGGNACIWELSERGIWCLIEKVPNELGMRFLRGQRSWVDTKCVNNSDGAIIWLYKEINSGMIAWREVKSKGKWEWFWVDGCCSLKGKKMKNFEIKGVFIHPTLASSCIF